MATKTISITDEAYGILKTKKESTESFSEAIVRLSGKRKLMDFFGVLSNESADDLEKEVKKMRKEHQGLHRKRIL